VKAALQALLKTLYPTGDFQDGYLEVWDQHRPVDRLNELLNRAAAQGPYFVSLQQERGTDARSHQARFGLFPSPLASWPLHLPQIEGWIAAHGPYSFLSINLSRLAPAWSWQWLRIASDGPSFAAMSTPPPAGQQSTAMLEAVRRVLQTDGWLELSSADMSELVPWIAYSQDTDFKPTVGDCLIYSDYD
jgi:hypothetical protein